MLFLFGWGKDVKKISYLGMDYCENCKNISHFYMYEMSKKVDVYFIPVARFHKKYFVACDICKYGNEVNNEEKNELIMRFISIPSKERTEAIWRYVDNKITLIMKRLEMTLQKNGIDFNKEKENLSIQEQEIYTKAFEVFEMEIKEFYVSIEKLENSDIAKYAFAILCKIRGGKYNDNK